MKPADRLTSSFSFRRLSISSWAGFARWWAPFERRLNRSDIQSVCILILAMYSLGMIAAFATQVSGRTAFGSQLGADYAAFYVAGTIYNTAGGGLIYDRSLQREVYHRLFPEAPPDEDLPYVNSPFFVLPFPLLARLPYNWAYLSWLAISLALFVAGFLLLRAELPARYHKASLLLSLSFMPFLVECLAGGQTSALGFFAIGLAIACERKGWFAASGFALSLCSYKPTLLLLVAPMLLVTRRFGSIGGLAGGTLLLSFVSWLAVGTEGCLSYLRMLSFFADASTGSAGILKSWKYVDVNSFSRLLFGEYQYLRWGVIGLALFCVLPLLIRIWWKADRGHDDQQRLVWALTITWTLVANIYLGIYDVTLVILGAVLAAGVFIRRSNGGEPNLEPVFQLLLVLLYLAPWITQPVARLSGVQLLTIVLALFGAYQMYRLGNMVEMAPPSERRFA
jgi:hypothetical protein